MQLTWKNFSEILNQNSNLDLRFIYNENQLITSDYHITEFKLAKIQSVNCGGNTDTWNEIILQVLEPNKVLNKGNLPVSKLLSISKIVENKIQIPKDSVLRIEFGNSHLAMRQFFVKNLDITESSVIVRLENGEPECKASSVCSLPDESAKQISSCCGLKNVDENTKPEKAGCC
ncbi:DUF6428 family protein [Leptospira sp. 96542]|nr:DUF6428 family protein [Leptospira sp. 96542]